MFIFCDKKIRILFLIFFFVYKGEECASGENDEFLEKEGDLSPGDKLVESIADFIKKIDSEHISWVVKSWFLGNVGPVVVKSVLFFLDKVFIYGENHELSRLQEVENEKLIEELRRKYMYLDRINMKENLENLACSFKKTIGQNKAKKEIEEQFSSRILSIITHEKNRCSEDRKGPGVEFVCFVGEPGLGKSYLSTCFAKALCLGQQGKEVFTIDASTLLNSSGGKRKVSSLCSSIEKKKGEKAYFVNSDFFLYVKSVRYPVVVFNELDKLLGEPDLQKDLSEFLRSIKEDGYIISDTGEKVDCSGLTIIFTSNNPKMFSDSSMDTRFNMIYFHPFSEEEYFEMFSKSLDSFLQFNTVLNFEEDIIVSKGENNVSVNKGTNRSSNSADSATSTRKDNISKKEQKKISFKMSCEGCRNIAKEAHSNPSLSSMGARCVDLFKHKLSGFLTREIGKVSNTKKAEGKEKGIVEGENIIGYKDGEFFFV